MYTAIGKAALDWRAQNDLYDATLFPHTTRIIHFELLTLRMRAKQSMIPLNIATLHRLSPMFFVTMVVVVVTRHQHHKWPALACAFFPASLCLCGYICVCVCVFSLLIQRL